MIRSRSRSSVGLQRGTLAALLVGSGCASRAAPLDFPTVSEAPDEPRHPPGVAVDPAPRLPEPRGEADTSGGIVVLRTPADTERARDVVRAFFRAVLEESLDDLQPLLDDGATTRSSMSRDVATSMWAQRFERLDYPAMAGQQLYRDGEIETYRGDELDALPPGRRPAVGAAPDDVVVRVKVSSPRLSRTRLFGDEILFLLRSTGTGYRIRELVEEFQLP